MLLILVAAVASFLIPTATRANIRTVTGTVTKVSGGDTVQITIPGGPKLRVRMYGMDAPETQEMNRRTGIASKPGQPYGDEWSPRKARSMGNRSDWTSSTSPDNGAW